MGGIHTDMNAATPLAGLFAAGECACVSINGANRLGSNSLAEILVFGARAGRAAAAFASANPFAAESTVRTEARGRRRRASATLFTREGGSETVAGLRKAMHDTIEIGRRHLPQPCVAAGDLRANSTELRQRYEKVQLQDRSNVFNTDLIRGLGARRYAGCRRGHGAFRRVPQGIARLAPAARLSRAGRSTTTSGTALRPIAARSRRTIELSRRRDHAFATGGAGLWRGRRMSETVTLEILRYQPETRQRAAFPDATPSPTTRTGSCSMRSITSRTMWMPRCLIAGPATWRCAAAAA